ncbi:MAG: lipid-A-disaccharide synthase, partial [Alphaproteobacteria bacterium]|nr:lipid-A-disaccharide synthase [Alphaproteobacteria bacterium]
ESRIPLNALAVMGIVEIVPHIRRIARIIDETVADVEAQTPAALVTIDAPAFSLRVSRKVRTRSIKRIHYVAPSVWAWRPGRARKIAAFLDHLLALLPFEPPYFEIHGLTTSFVGHPALEPQQSKGDGRAFRARHGIPADAPVLCVLPGSRAGEVRRHTPIFGRTLARLKQTHPDLCAVVPTVSTVVDHVRASTAAWPVPTAIVEAPEKPDAFAAANAALAASGTVSVELAAAGVPAVVAYRANWLSALIAAGLLKIKYVSLVNIVLDRPVQPEFLQHRCTPGRLAGAVARYLDDPAARAEQAAACSEALNQLTPGGASPSVHAARAILNTIGAGEDRQNTYTGPPAASER